MKPSRDTKENHSHGNDEHHHHDHDHEHDHDHHHDHHHLNREASKKSLLSAFFILSVFLVIEAVGGILSGSLALLSDAAHLITDVAAVALALFAQWFATRPPSPTRSYGYRRVEIVAALFNGLTLWVVAVYILIEGVERALDPQPIKAGMMLAVATAGLFAQIGAAAVLARGSSQSLNVRGAYIHALTDAVQSFGVIAAGLIIMFTGFTLIDPLISIAIGLLIIWSGGRVVLEAVHILLEGTPTDIDLEKLAKAMQRIPGVQKITDLHAWTITSGFNALSAHVVAEPSFDAADREELREHLNKMLRSDFSIHHSTLQVEKSCTMNDEDCCYEWIEQGKR
ncbi:MAG: cation transporter [Proteobacteria bacterium]|nr:cation transporter [Pseudomonadota bacterium]